MVPNDVKGGRQSEGENCGEEVRVVRRKRGKRGKFC